MTCFPLLLANSTRLDHLLRWLSACLVKLERPFHDCAECLEHILCCVGPLLCLFDDAVSERRGFAQPLPFHFEPTAFIGGHTPAVNLQIGLKKLPNPLLSLQLSVWVT